MKPVASLIITHRMASRAAMYSHAKTGEFTQTPPVLHNPYRDDPLLDRTLRRLLSQQQYDKVAKDLDRFGDRVVNEIDALGRAVELDQPRLEHQDAWGKRVDKLVVSKEWCRLKEICAEEGIISIGYDNDVDAYTRRIHQISKLFVFSPSAGLVTCPMAMTDGAVKTLQALGADKTHALAKEAVKRLSSAEPAEAWTSGQWMTEKRGGSDVAGGTDTYALHTEGDVYKLHGYKWFSSAIDSDVALTLARIVDKDGNATTGTKGISLFLLRVRNDDGSLNGLQLLRLKDKLGTRQVPTGELLLDGAVAHCLGNPGRGVAAIANMLNITRIHNAVASIAGMRRIISLARDYSTRREVFGQMQAQWPLHTATIAKLEVQTRACFMLLFESARLIGKQEADQANQMEMLMLRLITPILKLFAGKLCVPAISEGIECFGGQGYMEDTGLPTLLRDAQVTPIWEGTTNVLSLDVLRVFSGRDNVLRAFRERIQQLLSTTGTDKLLQSSRDSVLSSLSQMENVLTKLGDASLKSDLRVDAGAREIAMGLARIYSGALLIEAASDATGNDVDIAVAHRWCCEQKLVDLEMDIFSNARVTSDRQIVFQNFTQFNNNSKL